MKILLFGANGQIGWELQRSLAPLGQLQGCTRDDIDFANKDDLRQMVRRHRPSAIVNAAAYTAVDKAESEEEKAYEINREAVDILAEEAKRQNAWLIHYSSDYVFDGEKKSAYTETDKTNPINIYGQTKLAGELSLQESGCKYLVFRTSWVYALRGNNFPNTVLQLAKERHHLNIVEDQIGAPTSAELIADVSAICLYRLLYSEGSTSYSGVYHLTSDESISWHQFAQYLISQTLALGLPLRTQIDNILPIKTNQYPLPAKRPNNSCLNTKKIKNTFAIYLPKWQIHAQRFVKEWINKTHYET